MNQYEIIVLDLDGTLILGDEKTPYAAELIDFLNHRQREFFIITNGCALSPGAIWEKLKNMNIKGQKGKHHHHSGSNGGYFVDKV